MSENVPHPVAWPAPAPQASAAAAHTVRGLSMDAVQKASSGHPGAPMGMADMAVALWTRALDYDPADPAWPDRDRVVLSNGHASMLLYSMLHLSGTALSLDDLKSFRQWGARTAGHPEYGYAPGIETTTGPLGQGIANGVGMALAEARLRAEFGEELVDHHTYVFAGDGCLMEGVCYEAAAMAGHWRLGKLIVLFDDNAITIDGDTGIATSEDVTARFEACGWQVLAVDGHNQDAVAEAIFSARDETQRPTLIRCRTTIGFGAPTKAGKSASHGAPLGEEELAGAKRALGLDPTESFAVPAEALAALRSRDAQRAARRAAWSERLAAHPHRARFEALLAGQIDLSQVAWPDFETGRRLATRKASAAVLNAVAKSVPGLVGGSADLAGSNGSTLKGEAFLSADDFRGRNVHFGIREHAMASVCNGLSLHGGQRPYCATFLVFHDYMRPAVRLAALMHQPVIYVYTHDSVYLGEDGPTHQPVEHLAAMRTIPGLWVVRPADAAETAVAWELALTRTDGPVALCLTRQGVPTLDRTQLGAAEGARQGGYVLAEASSAPQVVLVATGSEVETALSARERLEQDGIAARVVSLPCWEVFMAQSAEYKAQVLPAGVPRVSVEAGTTFGWQAIVGLDGATVGIDRFGASAPGAVVARELGITPEAVVAAAQRVLSA